MGAVRRFLNDLEQGVGRLLGEPIGTGEDRHPGSTRIRAQAEEFLEASRVTTGPHPSDRDPLLCRVLQPEVRMRGHRITGPGAVRQQLGGETENIKVVLPT